MDRIVEGRSLREGASKGSPEEEEAAPGKNCTILNFVRVTQEVVCFWKVTQTPNPPSSAPPDKIGYQSALF